MIVPVSKAKRCCSEILIPIWRIIASACGTVMLAEWSNQHPEVKKAFKTRTASEVVQAAVSTATPARQPQVGRIATGSTNRDPRPPQSSRRQSPTRRYCHPECNNAHRQKY